MSITFKTATAIALVLAGMTPALAQDGVEQAAAAYVASEGFEPQVLATVEGAFNDLIGSDPEAMVPKDADISPIEKALLLIDTQEVALSRVRYVLRYNQRSIGNIDVSFVDIQRYNLGPAIRLETIDDYGAENTADPEAFGIGPNVEWRFVTQPTSKQAAMLLAASRREISDADAAATDCLPRSCLSLDPFDDLTQWSDGAASEKPIRDVAYPAIVPSDDPDSQEVAPAYQALQLAIASGLASASPDGIAWDIPQRQGGDTDSPLLVVLIDRNLGQEIMSDAALGVAKFGLDSDEHWTRLSSGYYDGHVAESVSTAQGQLLPPGH